MLVIVDYRMGNLASVKKAFEKIGAAVLVSNKKEDIVSASHLVLPGVGAFGDGVKNLKNLNLVEALTERVIRHKTPLLGICLGMQLLAKTGYEFGLHSGLGWLEGNVKKLEFNKNIRLPHIGWNNIQLKNDNLLFKDIKDNDFYFVHSYHLTACPPEIVTSVCEYGQTFVASIAQDNIFATQFHPEKSQQSGLQLLKNFLTYQYA